MRVICVGSVMYEFDVVPVLYALRIWYVFDIADAMGGMPEICAAHTMGRWYAVRVLCATYVFRTMYIICGACRSQCTQYIHYMYCMYYLTYMQCVPCI